MNSSIAKKQTNEKMKEEGENPFNQFDERIANMERQILDMGGKYENGSEDNKKDMLVRIKENSDYMIFTVKRPSPKLHNS